jgi:hypothetical protein
MPLNRVTRGRALVGSVNVGGGSNIKKIQAGTVSLDPGSIAAATRGSVTFTLTGARAGDRVYVTMPAALEDDLLPLGARVTADDTVTVYLYNPTAGAIDGAALTWDYLWLDLT